MPAVDRPVSDLNEPNGNPASLAVGAETDEWTAPTVTKKAPKKTKKSKKNAPASKLKSENGDESPAQPNSLASSPPNDQISRVSALPATDACGYDEDQKKYMTKIERDVFQDDIPKAPQQVFETERPQSTCEPDDLLLEEIPLGSDERSIEHSNKHVKARHKVADAEDLVNEPDMQQLAHFTPIPPRSVSIPSPSSGASTLAPIDIYSYSRSPPTATGPFRPRSFKNDLLESTSPPAHHYRRDSYQPSALKPAIIEAPLPHKAQSHFFSIPDLGLNLAGKQEQGKIAGSDGCCCCFDSFTEAGNVTAAKRARDVLLVGSEGGLDVYRVISDKLEVIGRLEGLRGAVVGAKILPRNTRRSSRDTSGLLVAVIIYGVAQKKSTSLENGEPSPTPRALYQTSVEIFSLTTQQYVATLYQGAAEPQPTTATSIATPLGRSGEEFEVNATGNFVVLASGKSGEIWVYQNFGHDEIANDFQCLGKFWTAVQTSQDPINPAHATGLRALHTDNAYRQPLYSLSNRWLAIVPPYTSAGVALRGSPTLPEADWPVPGLHTQLAPVQPPVTCEVAGIDAEGTMSWLSRKAAQGLVKASQRGYEIGVQGWKELTNPTMPPGHDGTSSNAGDLFPPTNAPAGDPQRLAKEPALVSIVDLNQLVHAWERGSAQASGLLATFALIEGCNHLSFSTDGTKLLTANRKGEAYTVWDLQYAAHGKTRFAAHSDGAFERGPHIRQIHRISRSSPSTVVESVWSRDSDRVAVLTTHGTIHLHEITSKVADKRRRRRSTLTATKASEKAEPTVGVSEGLSPPSSHSFWNTVRSSMQSVGAQVNAIRSQGSGLPTTFAGFREVTAAAGQAGGRAVAKGFSQGYSAAKGGASDIWHAEDNKIRQKALQNVVAGTAVLRWMQRKGDSFLAVVSGGVVHLYPVQQEVRRKGNVDVTGLRKFAPRMFTLPRIAVQQDVNGCSNEGPHGFWTLHEIETAQPRARDSVAAQATDVESNPPYCPFHVDSRVSIFAFDDGPNASQVYKGSDIPWQLKGHGKANETAWTFGDALPPSTKVNTYDSHDMDDVEHSIDGDEMDGITNQVESRLTIRSASDNVGGDDQIRVNTRRTRGRDEGRGRFQGFGGLDEDVTNEVAF